MAQLKNSISYIFKLLDLLANKCAPCSGKHWILTTQEIDLFNKFFVENYKSLFITMIRSNMDVLNCPGPRRKFVITDEDGITVQGKIDKKEWKRLSTSFQRGEQALVTVRKDGIDDFRPELLKQIAAFTLSLLIVMIDSESMNKKDKPLFKVFNLDDLIAPWGKMLRWQLKDFVPYAKYICAYPLARSSFVSKEQELPVLPKGFDSSKYFFEGRLKRAIEARARGSQSGKLCKMKNLRFLWNWNNAKRGCKTVPNDFVESALLKHKESMQENFIPFDLTGKKILFSEDTLEMLRIVREEAHEMVEEIERMNGVEPVKRVAQESGQHYRDFENLNKKEEKIMEETHQRALDCAKILVRAMIPEGDCLCDELIKLYECSRSASYEMKVANGGGRALVRQLTGAGGLGNEHLFQMHEHPRIGTFEVRTDCPSEFRVKELWDIHNHCMQEDTSPGVIHMAEEKIESNRLIDFFEPNFSDPELQAIWEEQSSSFMKPRPLEGELPILQVRREESTPLYDPDFLDLSLAGLGIDIRPSNTRKLRATVATVLEPLKVRVLTKGETVPQYIAKPLQNYMWKALKKLEPFSLIGETISPSHLNNMSEKMYKMKELYEEHVSVSFRDNRLVLNLKDDVILVSGDYSAATDGLNPWLSQKTLQLIVDVLHVPTWYAENALHILGNHQFDYGPDTEQVCQRKGQLMGSVLSFPLLCIMNMIGYMLLFNVDQMKELRPSSLWQFNEPEKALNFCELDHKTCKKIVNKLSVLINGDDILFACKGEQYQKWKKVILPHIGFTLSLGKNLSSRDFCTINSRMFTRTRRETREERYKEKIKMNKKGKTYTIRKQKWEIDLDTLENEDPNKTEFCYDEVGNNVEVFERYFYKKEEIEEKITIMVNDVLEEEIFTGRIGEEIIHSYELTTPMILVERDSFEPLPFLNLSLLQGRGKTSTDLNDHKPLWEHYNQCLDDCENIHMMNFFFFKFNKEQIKDMTSDGKFNLYLPRSLGGCGFKGTPKDITYYQSLLASYLYRRHSHTAEPLCADMGLVSRTKTFGSVHKDPFKGCLGIRVRKFDVPTQNYIVKPKTLSKTAINSGDVEEKLIERRFPIELPKETHLVKNKEKLLQFSDDLKVLILRPGRTGNSSGSMGST